MAENQPDLSGLLNGLLSNPGALSALVGALGSLRPQEASAPASASTEAVEGDKEPAAPAASDGASLPVMAAPAGRRHPERYGLLCALSPFLSPARRRAVDGAVRILEVLELFENAK